MKIKFRSLALALAALFAIFAYTADASAAQESRRIIRVGHNQSTAHPTHIGLMAFEEFIESRLGDKYDVQVYPSELLGSQNEMVQLTQTGAINFCVASNSLLETFSSNYTIFNLPYLFASSKAYHAAMDDESLTGPVFESTKTAGFTTLTWLDAGSRSFYLKSHPVEKPEDLRGLKIRVQQSPTNVRMMELMGGSATPMGFGDVYTALQAGIIDGAENNEMSLTDNGHGDICKYYSYDMHQMIPDLLIGNNAFLEQLPADEREIFEEGFAILNQVQRTEWVKAVENAKKTAQERQGVQFNYPDTSLFQAVCSPLHEDLLKNYPQLVPTYEAIQAYNKLYPSDES